MKRWQSLQVPGWTLPGLSHGFGARGRPVPSAGSVIRVRQVHGAELVVADGATPALAGEADGLVTATPGITVAIATADCVPVLFVAPRARVVAAVHAGWRGTLAGIVPRAVESFSNRFGVPPGEISAALGPSIGGCCYEIDEEIWQRFEDGLGAGLESAWRPTGGGKGRLDLRVVNQALLVRAGVPAIAIRSVGPCTACGRSGHGFHRGSRGPDLASYRRLGRAAGRQSSWIGLTAE
jgi:YfiH family protein